MLLEVFKQSLLLCSRQHCRLVLQICLVYLPLPIFQFLSQCPHWFPSPPISSFPVLLASVSLMDVPLHKSMALIIRSKLAFPGVQGLLMIWPQFPYSAPGSLTRTWSFQASYLRCTSSQLGHLSAWSSFQGIYHFSSSNAYFFCYSNTAYNIIIINNNDNGLYWHILLIMCQALSKHFIWHPSY